MIKKSGIQRKKWESLGKIKYKKIEYQDHIQLSFPQVA